MVLQIRIRGVGRVITGFTRLPQNLSKNTGQEIEITMKNIQKSAKLRAPRWTGHLAESISLARPKRGRLAKQWVIKVGAPYGIMWEEGFRPHWVRLDRSTRSGFKVADWAAQKGLTDLKFPISKGSLRVGGTRNKRPFIKPAFEKHIRGISNRLSRAIQKAIKEAGFR